MIALAYMHQLDVNSEFLYTDLEEEIWMAPTPDMDLSEVYGLRLLKSLYKLNKPKKNIFESLL